MTLVVLDPAGGTPVCPFDQSYDNALCAISIIRQDDHRTHYASISWLWLKEVETMGIPH